MAAKHIPHSKTPRNDLTAEYVRSILAYDKESGILRWNCIRRGINAGDVAGCETAGAVRLGIDGRLYCAHRIIWLIVTGRWPTHLIDHVNCDPLDNRWSNLRQATNAENLCNRGAPRGNTSGHKGVSYNNNPNAKRKWIAKINKKHLGSFDTMQQAIAAYKAAAAILHKEFSRFK